MRQGEWKDEHSIGDYYAWMWKIATTNKPCLMMISPVYDISTPVGICPLLVYNCLSVGLRGLHLKFMPTESLAGLLAEAQEDMKI